MLLSEFSAYQSRIEVIRRRQARDTLLTVPTEAELIEYFESRAKVDPGRVSNGDVAVARALASIPDASARAQARDEIENAKSPAQLAAIFQRYGLGQWSANAAGVAATDRSLAHLDRDGAVGVSTLRAMNRASRAFWNR